jgi:hypothetical protein
MLMNVKETNMTTNTAHRISRRGFRPQVLEPRLNADFPCLHPDVAIDDTGR